jgi:5-methylthioadenosine/S-adenosylhomocysteine deaminase
MATINGARALGLDSQIGSLEKGKYADIVAVDFNTLELSPVYNPMSHLVYSCGREHVTDVWVAGKHLLKERALTTLDENKIIHKTRGWNDKISPDATGPKSA